MLFIALVASAAAAAAATSHVQKLHTCNIIKDTDVNPHTAGLGSVGGSDIGRCCAICSSPEWWARGCRFSTLSRGRCWLKAGNATVARSLGKTSVECTAESAAPPPPPPVAPPPPKGTTGPWKLIGPTNIGDDVNVDGEAGTLADAASPAKNPNVMYAGGQNNGAASGVLRSLDGGRHWTQASSGLWSTKVEGVHVVDDAGAHVLVAVVGALYESLDYAATWRYIRGSSDFGTCNTFKNGTIDGAPHVLVGCSVGVANAPSADGSTPLGDWEVIPPGGISRTYLSVSDSKVTNSVLGACLGKVAFTGVIINRTFANWTAHPNPQRRQCIMLALNPNNADHFIYSTTPAPSYQTFDGGKTFEAILGGMWHVGIDRLGRLYQASMSGAFVCTNASAAPQKSAWRAYYSRRIQRRTNLTVYRRPHDYQRIALDFGGRVSFPSDQGLFKTPAGTGLLLETLNGNLSNNIALAAAVSKGDGPGKRFLVTAAWDWAPLASWDSGVHWPSWQKGNGVDDGGGATCIGEGGGAYSMGTSNNMLVMHHHNIMHSSYGGKNMSRFVVPHGGTVFAPTYATQAGSRHEPNGAVYAPVFMGPLPWNKTEGKRVECTAGELVADLGVLTTNYTCLSAVDLGTQYGWYRGVNYAAWRGDTDRHCYACRLVGNSSEWTYVDAAGAWSYAYRTAEGTRARAELLAELDSDGDGRIDVLDLRATQDTPPKEDEHEHEHEHEHGDEDEEARGVGELEGEGEEESEEGEERGEVPSTSVGASSTSLPEQAEPGLLQLSGGTAARGPQYILKNFAFGGGWNWTYQELPPHLQDKGQIHHYMTNPDRPDAVYAVAPGCIARSDDRGDTWGECWRVGQGVLVNFTGVDGILFKNDQVIFLYRGRMPPLRTMDGGATWRVLESVSHIAQYGVKLSYSWSGKTLVVHANGGVQSADHPHTAYVWKSTDDGDTWTDETDDIVTNRAGITGWYEKTLYMSSMGQGIFAKDFE